MGQFQTYMFPIVGPSMGIPFTNIKLVFGTFGKVMVVHVANETGARVIVWLSKVLVLLKHHFNIKWLSFPKTWWKNLVPQTPQMVQKNDSFLIPMLALELAIQRIYPVHNFI